MDSSVSFGVGRRTINPEMTVSLAGYFNARIATEVFDDIEVRALVLRKNGKSFLLLHFDLITVTDRLYHGVMDAIADLTEFSPENVLMTAIHTHTASDYRPSSQVYDPACIAQIIREAAKAVREAAAQNRAGAVFCTQTSDDRFLFNRRYWMKNGTVLTNPGKLNPEIDRPEGEIDPDIPLCAVRDESGEIAVLLAGIVNHTDTIGGTEVSADWTGFLHRELEKRMAPGGVMFTLVGASGNINHFDTSTDMNQTCYAEAKRIGLGYAETVKAALPLLKPVDTTVFRTFYAELKVGAAEVSDGEVAEAKATLEKYRDVPTPAEAGIMLTSEQLAAGDPVAVKFFAGELLRTAENKKPFVFRLSGLEIGGIVFASLPSEPFTEIGLEIRKNIFADKICFVVSHGNGTGSLDNSGGYIPNLWNYGRGGYETEVMSNPFERHTGEKLAEAWRKMKEGNA